MTTVFAVLFMLGALALAILGQRGPSSIVGALQGRRRLRRARRKLQRYRRNLRRRQSS